MSKGGGFLTPKAISNRIKSVGLQRLRWYCQMCEKQCRDENGFRNHMSSESHLRQMKVFADNPNRYLSEFSKDFEKGFMDILSHRHGTKRVKANQVYQEYIADKHHIHMNSTVWTSLAGFVQYLGKEGKVVADETEKGWYIQYIDRDPKLLAKQQQSQDKEQADLDEEERQKLIIEAQIKAASSALLEEDHEEDRVLVADHEKVAINFSSNKRPRLESHIKRVDFLPTFNNHDIDKSKGSSSNNSNNNSISDTNSSTSDGSHSQSTSHKGLTALDEIMREEENRKQRHLQDLDKQNRKDYWLHSGIVVKVINKDISNSKGSLYNQKGVVTRVVDRYGGDISLHDGTVVRLDQTDVETVIPKVGGKVMIVNGVGRGNIAILLKINEDEYNCLLKIEDGPLVNTEIKVAYEDFSKLSS